MKIWLTRHGQTNLNKAHLMQGLTDEPLNDTGRRQAEEARQLISGQHFDAVYASPLIRAIVTASLIGAVEEKDVRIDKRIIEADFGPYEKRKYWMLGPAMTLYWALPEIFPAPAGVETIESMVRRSRSFLEELEKEDYENVLITCHGGIMRVLSGCLMNRKKGIYWRPKPHNCEIRVFEKEEGQYRLVRSIRHT